MVHAGEALEDAGALRSRNARAVVRYRDRRVVVRYDEPDRDGGAGVGECVVSEIAKHAGKVAFRSHDAGSVGARDKHRGAPVCAQPVALGEDEFVEVNGLCSGPDTGFVTVCKE